MRTHTGKENRKSLCRCPDDDPQRVETCRFYSSNKRHLFFP